MYTNTGIISGTGLSVTGTGTVAANYKAVFATGGANGCGANPSFSNM